MEQRAKTYQEKRAFIEQIFALWIANPDLRFGQLIENASAEDVIYCIEDSRLLQKMKDLYK